MALQVSNDINERLQSLEQLSGKWADYEAALAQLQSWFHQQEDKIKRYRLIGHEVGVKQTLKDCKVSVCVSVCVRAHACMCICVCVCMRI